jgi:hypothetical protein
MALPLLKLIDMTGDLSVPKTVVLLQVLPAGGRRRLGRLTLRVIQAVADCSSVGVPL